jgi:hypothetical protein
MGIGIFEGSLLVVAAICAIIVIIPFWKIFSKAGFFAPFSLLMAVPVVNVLVLYYVAFAKWPVMKKKVLSKDKYDFK